MIKSVCLKKLLESVDSNFVFISLIIYTIKKKHNLTILRHLIMNILKFHLTIFFADKIYGNASANKFTSGSNLLPKPSTTTIPNTTRTKDASNLTE